MFSLVEMFPWMPPLAQGLSRAYGLAWTCVYLCSIRERGNRCDHAILVDGYTLTLAVNPWNIVRTYNLTPGRELLFACRYRLGTASNFVVYMSEADNVYDPLYGSFAGDEGAWSTAKMYFTVPPNGVAKLHFGAHFQAPGLPNQTAGTVDVYGLQILDATLEDTAALALLLKHEFLDGGADDVALATLGEVLLEHAHRIRQFFGAPTARAPWPRPALRWELRHDPERLRLAALRSLRRLDLRAGAAVGGHAGPVQPADQGLSLPGRVGLRDGPANRLAGPHGLGQGNVSYDQLLCNDVSCTDVFTTGVDASGAVSCAALTATGAVTGQLAEHHRGGQRGPAELGHRNHRLQIVRQCGTASSTSSSQHSSSLDFRQLQQPKLNMLLRLPWLSHPDYQWTTREVLRRLVVDHHNWTLPFHLPSTKLAETPHPRVHTVMWNYSPFQDCYPLTSSGPCANATPGSKVKHTQLRPTHLRHQPAPWRLGRHDHHSRQYGPPSSESNPPVSLTESN